MIQVALERLAEVGFQDGIGGDDVLAFFAGAITVLTFFGLLARSKAWTEFKDFVVWLRKFRTDWDGEDARDGRDHTPGVMERLNNIDGEFRRNGGATLKDAVVRTEAAVNDVSQRLQVVEKAQRDNARSATDSATAISSKVDEINQGKGT